LQVLQYNLPASSQQEMQIHGSGREMILADEKLYQDCKIVVLRDLRLDPKNIRFRHVTSYKIKSQSSENGMRYGQEKRICNKIQTRA